MRELTHSIVLQLQGLQMRKVRWPRQSLVHSRFRFRIRIYDFAFAFTISHSHLRFRIRVYDFAFAFTISHSRSTISHSHLRFYIRIYDFAFAFTILHSRSRFAFLHPVHDVAFELFNSTLAFMLHIIIYREILFLVVCHKRDGEEDRANQSQTGP